MTQHKGNKSDKTRDLSTLDYLEILENEWWICNLRRKIYPEVKDKKFHDKVANLKRDRIKEICERNEIESIFTDSNKMKFLSKKFMKDGGMPVFDGITKQDIENYYLKGNDVRCFYGFENSKPKIKFGKITAFDFKTMTVVVEIKDGEEEKLFYNKVSRIV